MVAVIFALPALSVMLEINQRIVAIVVADAIAETLMAAKKAVEDAVDEQ